MSREMQNYVSEKKQEPKQIIERIQSLVIQELPVVIEKYESIKTKVGEDAGSKGDKNRYVGKISGLLTVPIAKFSTHFSSKVPFSSKKKSGIALSFKTNDFTDDKLALLNQFVFGERDVKPIVLNKEAAVKIVTSMIDKAKVFDKLKPYWQKAVKFITENNISINIFIDRTEKKYIAGFFWKDFKIDKLPQEIKLQDVIFGISLHKTETKNEFGVMIGGKGSFTTKNKTESNIFISYSYNNEEQRLQFEATFSVVTTLLQLLGVKFPKEIVAFTQRNSLSVEWITDSNKKIMDEIKNGEQNGDNK